jgi:CRP/FNR family transcriptional regulator, cyclic AMP receptor protein
MKAYTPLGNVQSVLPILSKISFLGGVTDQQLNRMGPFFETATFAAGEYVARQGEEPSHIHIIKTGTINLVISAHGCTVSKRNFQVGDSFGEAAMLSMINHTASFVAAEPSELIVLSRRALNQLRKDDADLFCRLILNLARDLARKLQYTDEMLLR